MLVASLAACGGGEDKPVLPVYNGKSASSAPTTSRPTTAPPTSTSPAPAALAPHATYTYGALKVLVNLPADIPSASLPSVRLFSGFLQAVGQTTADNKADPRLGQLANPQVAKYLTDGMDPKAAHNAGTLTFTVTKIQPAGSHLVTISGCMDQSKAFPVDNAGKAIADTSLNPILKMIGSVSSSRGEVRVSGFAFSRGDCS